MNSRNLQIAFLLAALTLILVLAACDDPSSENARTEGTVPQPKYLTEEIPPCTPAPGSSVDPCEPDVAQASAGDGSYTIGPEPRDMRVFLGGERLTVSVAHLVVRGTYLPGTVRCTAGGDRFRSPPYLSWDLSTNAIKCYADVRVNAYVLGSGPPTLTVLVWDFDYWFTWEQGVVEEWRSSLEGVLTEGGDFEYSYFSAPGGGITGREMVLFVGPAIDASAEAWEVFRTWDVERREDGTAVAVHPFKDDWRDYTDDYQTYRSVLEMELPAFKQAVTEAHQERLTEYGGRTAANPTYPMLVSDAHDLTEFMESIGAYDHPNGPPAQPPPPCGLAVPDQADNPGLMRDCMALLAARDTLAGTATLNWGVDTAITGWDGVTVSSTTPKNVTGLDLSEESLSGSISSELGTLLGLTRLDLSDNDLTGEIPRELGQLENLEELRLSGNNLTGCIPEALEGVSTNDLSSLGLPYCRPTKYDVVAMMVNYQSR